MFAGPEIAFEAFSVLDGFGRPSAPLHVSKTLVPTVLAALDGSKPIARARREASDGQLGFALQVAFMEALPKVTNFLSPSQSVSSYSVWFTHDKHAMPKVSDSLSPLLKLVSTYSADTALPKVSSFLSPSQSVSTCSLGFTH